MHRPLALERLHVRILQVFRDVRLSQATQLLACRVEGKSLIDFSSVDSRTKSNSEVATRWSDTYSVSVL